MNLDKQSLAIDATVDNEPPVVECPFCSEFIYYDWSDAEGIGDELTPVDCPHYIGRYDDGDTATFISTDMMPFWKNLNGTSSPVLSPLGSGWYSARLDHNSGRYLALRVLDTKIERTKGFRDRWDAAMWCVEDVLERIKNQSKEKPCR